MIASKIADSPRVLVAAPSYAQTRGLPTTVADLAGHDCLPFIGVTHWTFETAAGEKHLRLSSRFSSSSIEGCRAVCLAGGGISLQSAWNVADDVATGRLARISLSDGVPQPLKIWAVYPTNKLLLPKVRVFIAALRTNLSAHDAFHPMGSA